MKPFSCLVADIPWRFGDSLPGPKRGASKHYKTMSVLEAKEFPLPPLADDAILFFWRVASMQEEALEVIRTWGFTVKTELVWVKTTAPIQTPESFKLAFGMGRYTRASHETCLIATKGIYKVKSRSERSVFFAPRGEHSAKPPEFYSIVKRLTRGPEEGEARAELFARVNRAPSFVCWGDELEGRPASPALGQ